MPDTPSPTRRSRGNTAVVVPNSRHVLLLLDIQVSMLQDPPIGVPAAHSVRNNLACIIAQARDARPPPLIIHVRNAGDVGDPDEPDTEGWQLIFPVRENELVIDKMKNNAFAGTELADVIPPDAEIVIVGFQTDFSIRATCTAALARGNEVVLIRGAHATFDRIEVQHGGGITPAKKIEADIEANLEEAGVHLLDMADLPGLFTNRCVFFGARCSRILNPLWQGLKDFFIITLGFLLFVQVVIHDLACCVNIAHTQPHN